MGKCSIHSQVDEEVRIRIQKPPDPGGLVPCPRQGPIHPVQDIFHLQEKRPCQEMSVIPLIKKIGCQKPDEEIRKGDMMRRHRHILQYPDQSNRNGSAIITQIEKSLLLLYLQPTHHNVWLSFRKGYPNGFQDFTLHRFQRPFHHQARCSRMTSPTHPDCQFIHINIPFRTKTHFHMTIRIF